MQGRKRKRKTQYATCIKFFFLFLNQLVKYSLLHMKKRIHTGCCLNGLDTPHRQQAKANFCHFSSLKVSCVQTERRIRPGSSILLLGLRPGALSQVAKTDADVPAFQLNRSATARCEPYNLVIKTNTHHDNEGGLYKSSKLFIQTITSSCDSYAIVLNEYSSS